MFFLANYNIRHAQYKVPFLLLASTSLQFVHPTSKEVVAFKINMPQHITDFMTVLDGMVKPET